MTPFFDEYSIVMIFLYFLPLKNEIKYNKNYGMKFYSLPTKKNINRQKDMLF